MSALQAREDTTRSLDERDTDTYALPKAHYSSSGCDRWGQHWALHPTRVSLSLIYLVLNLISLLTSFGHRSIDRWKQTGWWSGGGDHGNILEHYLITTSNDHPP